MEQGKFAFLSKREMDAATFQVTSSNRWLTASRSPAASKKLLRKHAVQQRKELALLCVYVCALRTFLGNNLDFGGSEKSMGRRALTIKLGPTMCNLSRPPSNGR